MSKDRYQLADDPTEQLLFSTIRISTEEANGAIGSGTGFFFELCERVDGTCIPVIVTNWHVVKDAVFLNLVFRQSSDDLARPAIGQKLPLKIENPQELVIRHPDASVDLCIIPLTGIIRHFNDQGERPWIGPLNRNLLIDFAKALRVRAIEDILMVGYPNGLQDDVNDMPLVRRGITATHPLLDWQGRKEFLIDAACFPGSSGSPVFLFREMFTVNQERQQPLGIYNIRLLGILSSGPQYSADGEIHIVDIPTAQKPVAITQLMLNLGIVIKAEALMEFEDLFNKQIENGNMQHVANPLFHPPDEDHVKSLIK